MPKPKGHKSENGYSTVATSGGLGYREIAEKMTSYGDRMNHSTARNIFLRAMRKIAKETCKAAGAKYDAKGVDKVASDPRFQSGLIDIIVDENI